MLVHVLAGCAALLTGASVLLAAKGTRRHRVLGRSYVGSMAVLLATSLGIYETRAGPTLFHGVTVLAASLVLAGVVAIRRGRGPGRSSDPVRWHLRLMPLSYLVLLVTFVAQFFDRLPLRSPALNAILFLQVPLVLGVVLIVRADRRRAAAGGRTS